MPAPFAPLQAQMTAEVIEHLTNAEADFGDDEGVDGIFDAGYVSALGIESTGPLFTCLAAALPAGYRDATVTINSIAYQVTGVEPDSTGLIVLRLDKS